MIGGYIRPGMASRLGVIPGGGDPINVQQQTMYFVLSAAPRETVAVSHHDVYLIVAPIPFNSVGSQQNTAYIVITAAPRNTTATTHQDLYMVILPA